ncbi:MAG: zf-TFIIB domain-containing protein [Myxococcaceae bacterium]
MALIRCPNCRTLMDSTEIVPSKGQPVLLDCCFKCGAIWFDRTELTRASKLAPKREATPWESKLHCPRCAASPLFEELLNEERELAFACYQCKGVLVTGEGVDKTLKLHRTGRTELPPDAPNRKDVDDYHDVCGRCGVVYETGHDWERDRDDDEPYIYRLRGPLCYSCRNDKSVTGSDQVDKALVGGLLRALGSLFD